MLCKCEDPRTPLLISTFFAQGNLLSRILIHLEGKIVKDGLHVPLRKETHGRVLGGGRSWLVVGGREDDHLVDEHANHSEATRDGQLGSEYDGSRPVGIP